MTAGKKASVDKKRAVILEWMLGVVLSGQRISDRKRYAFLEWLADTENEELKWYALDKVLDMKYNK